MPPGALLGGLIAGIDLRLPFLLAGGMSLLAALAGYRFVKNISQQI
jgi:NaMN:DMB phosphoribosyltransferase